MDYPSAKLQISDLRFHFKNRLSYYSHGNKSAASFYEVIIRRKYFPVARDRVKCPVCGRGKGHNVLSDLLYVWLYF